MASPEKPRDRGRRRFLLGASRVLAAAAGASLATRVLGEGRSLGVSAGAAAEKIRGFRFEELESFVTPTERFFLRSHLEVPRLDPGRFRLAVGGWVERPFSISFAELTRRPRVRRAVTFECSGNSVGGGMVSTAEWAGTLLAPLVEHARLRPGALELLMEGADAGLDELVPVPLQYGRSVPLEALKAIPGLLVWEMNGQPLRPEHGFPLRVVLPGLYGLQNVKWIVRLTVLNSPYRGFYQTQRYVGMRRTPGGVRVDEIQRQRVKSQIARIEPHGEPASGTYRVTGAAWSGGEGIRQVDVSTDGGSTWKSAVLEPARDPCAWVLWAHSWRALPGTHEVVARATDGLGRSQPLARDSGVLTGYVNNWCHRKAITVPG